MKKLLLNILVWLLIPIGYLFFVLNCFIIFLKTLFDKYEFLTICVTIYTIISRK